MRVIVWLRTGVPLQILLSARTIRVAQLDFDNLLFDYMLMARRKYQRYRYQEGDV